MAELPILKSPLIQNVNGVPRIVHAENEASQIKMSDGTSVEAKINSLAAATTGTTVTYVVNNIPARDALSTSHEIHVGDQVYVRDATGDNTVKKGAAKYICVEVAEGTKAPTWEKSSEEESMDLVLNWDDIEGKPDVTTEQIETIVSVIGTMKDHELTVDTNGDLLLDGKKIGNKYAAYLSIGPDDEGFDDAVAALDLADGAFFTVNASSGE